MESQIEIEHIAVPKLLPHAFLQAKAANKAPFPLLPGVMEVVVGNSYVGRGMMPLTAPGETMKLSLGIDESVRIELKLLDDKVERRRWGDKTATTNVFRITARNFAKDEVNLTVVDQLPISTSDQVKVKYGAEAKRALRGAEFPGQLQWLVKLAPAAERVIEFDFTIEFPQNLRQQLQEGNRVLKYKKNKMIMNSPALQRAGKAEFEQQVEDVSIQGDWATF